MTVINTNTASLLARDAIQRNDRAMSTAMERLSTGSRINSAKDDAAGLAIADRMGAQVSGLNMAVRNANDAISLLQTVDGAAQEISNMLNRMYELAVQAASGTYTSTDRTALDLEFGELMKEIQEIAERTEWNGTSIMDDTYDDTTNALKVQLGAESNQTMAVRIKDWRPTISADGELASATDTDTNGIDSADSAYNLAGTADGTEAALYFLDGTENDDRLVITSAAAAAIAVKNLNNAIDGAAKERAQYGAYISRLQHAADNLQNVATNTSASKSQISDADYATETTELARTQIISQASTAMLAQANQVKQTVLSLLR
ncbi:MAG: flagellin FliC [Gammaproteobacteria bacterium]|nr:flagellin FliC [Gammaproteobacteria bacterium]